MQWADGSPVKYLPNHIEYVNGTVLYVCKNDGWYLFRDSAEHVLCEKDLVRC